MHLTKRLAVGRCRLLQHRLPHRAEGPDRLRAPLRAHDVPGLGEPREDGVHPPRRVERRPPQRLDAVRLHQLLPGRPVARARDGALGRGRSDARPRHHAENLKNQQDVVKNEVKVNVLNQPYGGFPWIDLPMAPTRTGTTRTTSTATSSTSTPRRSTTCRPSSRPTTRRTTPCSSSTATFRPDATKAWIEKYFAGIPTAKLPPPADLREPRQEKEKRAGRTDQLANRPALGIGLPPAGPPDARVVRVRPDRSGCSRRARHRCSTRSSCARAASPAASTPGSTGASATCSTTTARCSGWRSSSTTPTRRRPTSCSRRSTP